MTVNPTGTRTVFLLTQAFLGLGLAVVADKISDIMALHLPELVEEPGIYILAGCLLTLSVATGLLSFRPDHRSLVAVQPRLAPPPQATQISSDPITYAPLPSLFLLPFGLTAGAGVSFLAMLLTPRAVGFFLGWYSHTYEISTWAVGVVALSLLGIREQRRTFFALTTFSVGYGLGAAALILLLEPEANNFGYTVVGWLGAMIAASAALSWLGSLPRRLRA